MAVAGYPLDFFALKPAFHPVPQDPRQNELLEVVPGARQVGLSSLTCGCLCLFRWPPPRASLFCLPVLLLLSARRLILLQRPRFPALNRTVPPTKINIFKASDLSLSMGFGSSMKP
jgi:hypothetical protein